MATKRIYHGVDINVLEGWLVKYNSKEKFFGSSSNKRWFKVDVANPDDDVSMHRLILSYFKAKKAKEVRGWIYLEDVTKINVKPNLIEIASPSRTLRVKGETAAEHKLWAESLQALRFPPPLVLPKSTAIVPSSLMATFGVDEGSKEPAAAAKAHREAKGETDAKAERKAVAEPLVDRERKSYVADVKPSERSLPPPSADSESSEGEDEADAKDVAVPPARSTVEVKCTSEPRVGPKAHLTATEPLQFSDSEDENEEADDEHPPAKRSLQHDVDEPAPSPKVDASNDSDNDDDDDDRFHDVAAPERHLSTDMEALNNAPTARSEADSDDDDSVVTMTPKRHNDDSVHDEDDEEDRNQEPPAQSSKGASAYFDDEDEEADEKTPPSKGSLPAAAHPGASAVAADNNFVTEDWDQDDTPVKVPIKAERATGGVAADANFAHADWDD
ncbi:hypothetical protein, variant [Saprolegnia diclina VS20]|uniref:PH domain-containing protein n=1 Tax=Saprolegnia diclina (strain VS20) TaxID=1156394 RepID=T0RWV3_SAPDV|nr:hypothetical protein, variant [Saprolegnia diclina VS20]EQC34852.1 hypothetical protein, variant [Saprolegnia diclina VS20]|eukprot:XP_008611724.1 hypothetical protein, variant [Saprolegnia diclina VS20]